MYTDWGVVVIVNVHWWKACKWALCKHTYERLLWPLSALISDCYCCTDGLCSMAAQNYKHGKISLNGNGLT